MQTRNHPPILGAGALSKVEWWRPKKFKMYIFLVQKKKKHGGQHHEST